MMLKMPLMVKAILFSALLYFLWALLEGRYVLFVSDISSALRGLFSAPSVLVRKEEFSYYLIPVLSLILAANGDLNRKLKYISAGTVTMVAYQIISVSSGVAGFAAADESASIGALGTTAAVVDHSFGLVFSILLTLLYFKRYLQEVWPKETPLETRTRCPICGKKRSGLVDHIRTVHGERSLEQPRVKRALERNT